MNADTHHRDDPYLSSQTDTPNESDSSKYTGVVIIHGIGDEKRNETLEEALNTLMYWFNHVAGLALRPDGPGRVWLRTALTISNDPDAPCSRATIELLPPAASGAATGHPEPLRIEMREVWWAQTFGLPSVGSALRWARVQFWDEWLRVLLPIGRHAGPARAAVRTPSREFPQAVTYRPAAAPKSDQQLSLPAQPTNSSVSITAPQASRGRRWALQAALRVYGFVQYFWKSLQWILLAPLVYLLLALITLTKLLAIIPFVQTAVIKGLSAQVDNVSLHWIAPMQVYLLDYARSSTIRQLFEREVAAFLKDDRCERVVVLAHSMGCVVAYEGLTTLLTTQQAQHNNHKPITFLTLGQALRRMWLLTGTDVHRLRIALPRTVRWINFWARYDPVSAGPLNASALPRIVEWLDPDAVNPYDEICTKLDECENVDVVNDDSLFSDHTSYWHNLDQVVGPIAHELVAGHPALESLTAARQASPDGILVRRWNVAWRAMLALAGGIGAAALLLFVNASTSLQLGAKIQSFLGALDLGSLVTDVLGPLGSYLKELLTNLAQTLHITQKNGSMPAPLNPVIASILAIAAALALLALIRFLVTWFISEPSPLAWRARAGTRRGTWSIYALTFLVLSLVLALVITAFATVNLSPLIGELIAAVLVLMLAWLLALLDARYRQRWGWFIVILLALPALLVSSFVNTLSVAIAVSLFGGWAVAYPIVMALTLAVIVDAVRRKRWLRLLVMLLTLPLAALWAALLSPVAPALAYGLLVGPNSLRTELTGDRRTGLLALLAVGVILLTIDYAVATSLPLGDTSAVAGITGLGAVSGITVVAGWIAGMVHVVRYRRWVWLVAVLFISAIGWRISVTFFVSIMNAACGLAAGCTLTQGFLQGAVEQLAFGLAPGLLGGILTYALVAGPPRAKKPRAATQQRASQPVLMGVRQD